MRGLEGKGVLVAGASRGIGEAAARRFLEEGCRVFICARHADGVEEALRGRRGRGEAGGVACDVSDPDDVARMLGAADAFLGGIDVLANNAGVAWQEDFLDITLEHWDAILDINLRGMILVSQGVARRMVARGAGGAGASAGCRSSGRLLHVASWPPSITRASPVMNVASSEARNA